MQPSSRLPYLRETGTDRQAILGGAQGQTAPDANKINTPKKRTMNTQWYLRRQLSGCSYIMHRIADRICACPYTVQVNSTNSLP